MNFVILTPISVEYDAVRKHLPGLTEKVVAGNRYEIAPFTGKHHSFKIILHRTGSKNSTIALAAEKAIQAFQPQIILLVGIAGGVKDVVIGDVVVGTKAYGYEAGKETADGFVTRPEVFNYSKELLSIAEGVARKNVWKERSEQTNTQTKVIFGPIASGDKVIASTTAQIYPLLKKHFNDTVALEMEAIGFGEAMLHHPHIRSLNIRGISDLLENKSKTDAGGSQELAAGNAAGFVFELLYELDVSQFKYFDMDVKMIAEAVFASLLPFLKKSKSVKKISSDISEATDSTMASVWKIIKPIFIEEFEEEEGLLSESSEEKVLVTHVLKQALKKEESMKQELEILMATLETKKTREKQVIKDAKVKAKNSIKIGDKTIGDDSHWDRKNIIEGGEFETEGDFHLGDG